MASENPPFSFMNQLWRKEPSSDGEVFVGFIPQSILPTLGIACMTNISMAKHRFLGKEFEPRKSKQVSTDLRGLGNEQFKKKCWRKAMEFYNESLRFAEEGSENISLAYANRSACFLHLQKYEKCFKDIDLAKTTNYPKRLTHKLEQRETLCVEQMEKAPENQEDIEPKLSFDSDINFPCMANVLEIRRNAQFGRHIVAKCDIDVGQTVLVEEPYAACFDSNDRTLCFTCMKPTMNFIPCPKCTDAMFCDENCMQSNDNHKIGCGAAYNRLPGINLVVDTIITALNTFSSVEDLMEFVERKLITSKNRLTSLPPNCHDAQSRYKMFLKLDARPLDTDADQLSKQYLTYKCIMNIPALQAQFNSMKKQRFLMHLIWQHKLISMNFFNGSLSNGSGNMQILANIMSLFNHSCAPNLHNRSLGNKYVCTTISPVKKGQQLFVTYKKEFDVQSSETAERQDLLNKMFGFTCECSRCVPSSRPNDSEIMQMDPNFQKILNLREDIRNNVFNKKYSYSTLKENCYEFLRKYGHLPLNDEILFVKIALMTSLDQEQPIYLETFEEF